jgi:hypothetical protein
MVKFVMMNEKMIEKDEQFIKMSRVSMLNLQKDQSMQDFLDLVTHITKKIHEHVDDKDMRKMNITSANLILKIIVGLGNGHEIVASAYHKPMAALVNSFCIPSFIDLSSPIFK